jgi:ribose transport system substrate-binding protein
MKKALAILLALLMVLAVVAGCGAKEEPKDEPTTDEPAGEDEAGEGEDAAAGKQIAVCMGSINHPVHRIVQMGFVLKAEELGMEGVISGLDEGSIQELIAKWESAVTNGAEGVLVWTGDDSCYDMMKGMKEMGVYTTVPHFVHNYEDTKDFIDKNISCLAATYGAEAAQFVVDKLTEKGITEGTIGITQNGPNVTENAANDGFRSKMAEIAPNFKLADTVMEGPEITEATNKVTSVIQANEADIVAGFGTTGGSPQSWAAAMENTKKTDLVVVGMDYTELNVNLVKDGKISAVVCQPLFPEAQDCAQALYDLFNGEVFNGSADTWFTELPAPLAYVGGEGVNDINSYQAIIDQVAEYFA